jgi:hypothetical protein
MKTSIAEISRAFHVFHEGLRDPAFSKSLGLSFWSERKLLPLARSFLLGWFGHGRVAPEVMSALPGKRTGMGRIDFVVGGVAVELAVRNQNGPRQNLSASVNADEIKKLMKFDGPAVLVLLDLTDEPLDDGAIRKFRDWPSLGQGNHKKSSFSVSYHYQDGESGQLVHSTYRIRV